MYIVLFIFCSHSVTPIFRYVGYRDLLSARRLPSLPRAMLIAPVNPSTRAMEPWSLRLHQVPRRCRILPLAIFSRRSRFAALRRHQQRRRPSCLPTGLHQRRRLSKPHTHLWTFRNGCARVDQPEKRFPPYSTQKISTLAGYDRGNDYFVPLLTCEHHTSHRLRWRHLDSETHGVESSLVLGDALGYATTRTVITSLYRKH
jgi:hypothetical protein